MNCPKCHNGDVVKKGFQYNKGVAVSQRYKCKRCEKQFNEYFHDRAKDYKDQMPNILIFDIETSLMEVYVWGLYKQFISHNNIIKDNKGNYKTWFMLSYAAKWLYDDNIISDIVTPEEAINRDDKRILKSIWKLLERADIVIAHNGDRFDLRKINARFVSNDILPPTSFRTIDTFKVTRREFAFESFKQDFLTKKFKLQEKKATGGIDLWIEVQKGNQEAIDKMLDYNIHDVKGLEDMYLKIRPYIKNHPNLGVLLDEDVCPNCASPNLLETDSEYFTSANRFPVLRCGDCHTPYIRHKKNSSTRSTNYRSVPK